MVWFLTKRNNIFPTAMTAPEKKEAAIISIILSGKNAASTHNSLISPAPNTLMTCSRINITIGLPIPTRESAIPSQPFV